ncbi:glutathione peroxidase [Lutimaribacter sp. EGI FJ00015]|uniref:Glutathione peroxidase n=1 Tax=Lutimaribacter degradans TaxID=2945989 RepID=A0ACC6A061_9RHOB|nr:glutathione peroxidase [Lutimaribacter sp. EGI FJ00013]MCM2563391.1 glutathione peroxidase [Lutimaribacter sp. EGI FJ00013]MCO0614530.1 glutathione peroxidase [Lutimaribacter sp. EGI FJ00015]MCO0637203.1 glutathione peroxidase [Lutimaribacter sp. EGI FJ00014]
MLTIIRKSYAPLMLVWLALAALIVLAPMVRADEFKFESIDGGQINLADWRGSPVLVVNTASRCGFTPQYDALQDLHERFGDKGLLVLAVPSNDFRQELASDDEVKEFCDVNFGLTLPMTTITKVKGEEAHPFYKWVADTAGFRPGWNFNKILLGPDGTVLETWGSPVRPTSAKVINRLEPLLPQG